MKFKYVIVITIGLLVMVSLVLVASQPDNIPYWNHIHDIKQQEFEDGCDKDCKIQQEYERGYICTNVDSG